MAGRCAAPRGALLALRSAQSFLLRNCPRSSTAAAPAADPEPPPVPAAPDAAAPSPASSSRRPQPQLQPSPPPPAVDFADAREAFRSKSSAELLRGLLVLRLCAVGPLVERAEQLMSFSRRLLGQPLFETLMKVTFYGQFVAGEDQEAIKPLIRHNRAYGVGSVLDYSVEEDLTTEEAKRKELE